MLTPQHSQEALTRAYIQAIAARVGLTCSFRDFDYGIDLTLKPVVVRTNRTTGGRRYVESGVALDIQIKSTTLAIHAETEVKYDLDASAYDDLRDTVVFTPRILVLHVQPKEDRDRLRLTPDGLTLAGRCYWMSLRGYPEVSNTSSVRISIPRTSVLSEDGLRDMMERVKSGGLL